MQQHQFACAISPMGLIAVLGGLSVLSLLIALGFWTVGAVWVLPFAMLEVLVLATAFLCHARALAVMKKQCG